MHINRKHEAKTMTKVRLDIGGPKGNAFQIAAAGQSLGKSMGWDAAELKALQDLMFGTSWQALGGAATGYEHLVRTFAEAFPFVEIYADRDVGLPEDLCKVITTKEVIEL